MGVELVEASDLVDRIKVIKSAEEQDLVRRAAAMQDGAMRAAFAAIEPGLRDRDIAAIAQSYSQRHGSEHGIYLCASMPADKPAQFAGHHYQNRVIKEGDVFTLLVEDAGPGGMYTELGRTAVVGKASQQLNKTTATTDYQAADVQLWDDVVALPLFTEPTALISSRKVGEVTATPTSNSLLWYAQYWAVRVPEATNNTTPPLPSP